MAQILTRSTLPLLTKLDASDFVECYAVTRLAKLKTFTTAPASTTDQTQQSQSSSENSLSETPTDPDQTGDDVKSPSSDNVDNTTSTHDEKGLQSTITVRKTAIAFRYRPHTHFTSESVSRYSLYKPKFELTLEYGPQRTGVDMDSEAMPVLLSSTEGKYETDEDEEKYVTWENEGTVYFEQSLSPERWDTADYIAPITGAVLEKILTHALEYPSFHPRYQPFEVYDVSRQNVVLRSSSSEDFVWEMFDALAKMYVDIIPILTPSKRKVRLFINSTDDIERVRIDRAANTVSNQQNTASNVVRSMEYFYSCAKQVWSADHELFLETMTSDLMPQQVLIENDDIALVSTDNDDIEKEIEYDSDDVADHGQNRILKGKQNATKNETSITTSTSVKTNSSSNQTSNPTIVSTLSSTPTFSPTDFVYTPEIPAAATATAIAKAVTAQQNLLSGDGSLITSALSPCFAPRTNPETNETESQNFYLFVDGSVYYKLNLIEPYWEAISVHPSMPTADAPPQIKVEFIDWFFVWIMAISLVYGCMKILVKERLIYNGKGVWWNHSTPFGQAYNQYSNSVDFAGNYDSDEDKEFMLGSGSNETDHHDASHNKQERKTKALVAGGGSPHNFAVDAIPLSMGGKRNTHGLLSTPSQRAEVTPIIKKGKHGFVTISRDDSEIVPIMTDDNNDLSGGINGSNHSNIGDLDNSSYNRTHRDPGLVELPDLNSSSRVAVPVGVSSPLNGD